MRLDMRNGCHSLAHYGVPLWKYDVPEAARAVGSYDLSHLNCCSRNFSGQF